MAGRSLTATPEGIQQINRALTGRGWSREDLAKDCDCSRQPAVKFCAGQAVSNKLFVSFCKALGLDWEDVAGQKLVPVPAETLEPETDIDALVQTVRAQVYDDIQARCGTMRVLDMEQPIGLGDIYTSVNILEKLSGRRRLGLDELLQDCDPENFDRFLLGQVRHKRVPGLEAVERHNQLMILGKPGAGKTTFMKRLAILCNQGEFQPQRVPVFVTLKDYAEAPGEPTLQTYIQRQWKACGVELADALSMVLGNGKALVLLDGLDEVYETDHDRVLQDIKLFIHQFRTCQCVITCRIAAREYTFEQFTEVEVADFDSEQIAEFATKWFAAKNDPNKAKIFIQRLNENQPIQELATNPLLLTLLCLVFGEAADFPANRAELYKEGLDVLLKKWDGKRNIERDQVYKKLSLKRKEDLLSQLAFETFEQGSYFFKQSVVEHKIIEYIRNLPGASDNDEALQCDGEAVLNAIEAQHGLLVERAKNIYSFSHLTFQEYFAARHLVSPMAGLELALQNLTTHITEKRYREVVLLTAGMLPEADSLLLLMKQHIGQFMFDEPANEPKLQLVLEWVQQKSTSANEFHKNSVIRTFYYALASSLARGTDFTSYDSQFSLSIDVGVLDLTSVHVQDLNTDLALATALAVALLGALPLGLNPDFSFVMETSPPELKRKIQCLKAELPSLNNPCVFEDWWVTKSQPWTEKLRAVIVEHRNIGHDWKFSKEQKKSCKSTTRPTSSWSIASTAISMSPRPHDNTSKTPCYCPSAKSKNTQSPMP
nr:NACHT domain-containing NTPase [Nodosilinea sp. LEGE 07298]